ncbi:hypothetical protein [uncultured Shewanella sp.]|uniref:hypothetical protein n=1 Tax=uncultured Shewanella sp. TaxID=173975 RepID=UPI002601C8D5|nr:hypothetical protein [uncultured Shewanella sp.]
MVSVYYTHRVGDNPELVEFKCENISCQRAYEIIDDYPWAAEIKFFEQYGEGGSFYFVLGDMTGLHAAFQFIPVDEGNGLLDVDILLKKGFLGIFGRKSKSIHFDLLAIDEAKLKIRDMFQYSLSALYNKY